MHTTPMSQLVDRQVNVNVDNLIRRLKLENKMAGMVLKMPNFCVTLICFICAIRTLVPSAMISGIHRRLYTHYGVTADQLAEVTDFDKLYDFIDKFEVANEAWALRHGSQHARAPPLMVTSLLPAPEESGDQVAPKWHSVCLGSSLGRIKRDLQLLESCSIVGEALLGSHDPSCVCAPVFQIDNREADLDQR